MKFLTTQFSSSTEKSTIILQLHQKFHSNFDMNRLRAKLAALLVAILFQKAACEDVFININGSSRLWSQVMFVDQRLDFAEAEANCMEKDATLVEMRTLKEWNEIVAWFANIERRFPKMSAVWIGLTDTLEEGTFVWLSGRPLTSKVGNVSWERGQPNNLIGNQGLQNDLRFHFGLETCLNY